MGELQIKIKVGSVSAAYMNFSKFKDKMNSPRDVHAVAAVCSSI